MGKTRYSPLCGARIERKKGKTSITISPPSSPPPSAATATFPNGTAYPEPPHPVSNALPSLSFLLQLVFTLLALASVGNFAVLLTVYFGLRILIL
ncbi:hypothetical protein Nepgr_006505 [Nepenthes gracilis]|uniref:Uncharacterized protein n=1 Tax=Nepenthes gracilis TaxID=150966 RepID=A0AAD3XHH3_NEPGR|nr:hypothetical protein Nepgr_006505 [Nepenthes gracilis]